MAARKYCRPNNAPSGLDGIADFGMDGSGIWCPQKSANIVTDNFVIDCAGYGLTFSGYYGIGGGGARGMLALSPAPDVPPFGSHHTPPPLEVSGNEVAGCFGGFWFTYSQGRSAKDQDKHDYVAIYDDNLVWNINGDAHHAYHDGNITTNRLTVICDPVLTAMNRGTSTNGLWSTQLLHPKQHQL